MDQKALIKRSEDQSEWYTQVVQRAKLADYSPVRGCMVIMPYGYALWENIQRQMDEMIKAGGVQNAYFPLFIPYSFLEKEADHVEGFAPEVAVVTHAGGSELEEKLAVRPTSETIIYHMFAQWVHSYRDLPLKINQWANVVRWEKRTQPFLRTTEFLWQEGHTIHKTKDEAEKMMEWALEMYYEFVTSNLAIYVTPGYKSKAEKFPGAETTTTIEGLMKDGKALQSGTSHLLKQDFAGSFGVKFLDESGSEQVPWPTSWGLSTRIIGGLILSHGDDKGLIIPPKVAPIKVQIIPIFKGETEEVVKAHVAKVEAILKENKITFETDMTDNSPGWKFAEAEMRGIPVRLEVGPRDVEADSVVLVMRTRLEEKQNVTLSDLAGQLDIAFQGVQGDLYAASRKFTEEHTITVTTEEEFMAATKSHIGYIKAFFNGDPEVEKRVKDATKFGTRCIPFESLGDEGKCIFTGDEGKMTLFAKAY